LQSEITSLTLGGCDGSFPCGLLERLSVLTVEAGH
jgi:hypothetical protein